MDSPKYSLTREDLRNWAKNSLIFFAPSLLLGLSALQAGFDWKYAAGIIGNGVLNAAIDILRKFLAEGK